MENAEPNAAVPLSIRTLASTVNVEEQAQNQTNLNSVVQTSDLPQIEFRIQQLQGRHLLLQKTLSCTKKEEEKRGASGAEPTSEDGDQMCELETIQKELQELEALKENMVGNGVRFIATGRRGPQVSNHVYRESPRGGIYTLPPPELQLEDTATQTREHQILPGVAQLFPNSIIIIIIAIFCLFGLLQLKLHVVFPRVKWSRWVTNQQPQSVLPAKLSSSPRPGSKWACPPAWSALCAPRWGNVNVLSYKR
ncbi:uncharacterized protein LOC101164847 isoform X2 [Oryzias latipes]